MDTADRVGRRTTAGFTLLEVLMSLTIVGLGILGSMRLFASCSQNNGEAAHTSTALFLANNIQEMMAELPFADPSGLPTAGLEEVGQPVSVWDDIDDFNGYSARPPIDASRMPVPELAQYRQLITVQSIDPNGLTTNAANADAARVTVQVFYLPPGRPASEEREVHRISWVRMRR
jgi:prepilin-type N-terminal cleavage/methylation domain-containing protein